MTPPTDPDQPIYDDGDPIVGQPQSTEPTVTEHVEGFEPVPTSAREPVPVPPPPPAPVERTAESENAGAGKKVTAAALLAGAAALANKVRQEAPKKVQEIREKRIAGRCVILTEVNGRQMAIGPYRDENAARQASVKATGVPTVIELVSPAAHFGPQDEDTVTR